MSTDLDKRERRIEKRALKRKGNQRVRRMLKRALIENPEEATEARANYGRCATAGLNGMDHDATKRSPR